MKTRIKYLQFNIAFLIIFVMGDASGQSATLTSNFTNESAVRSSQHQIQVTVSGDSIQPAIGSDNGAADTFLSGFSGGSIAFNAMIDALDATDIFLSSDSTIATIVVPSTGSYYIDSDENISFTIPSASLVSGGTEITAGNTIVILNEDPVISVVSETWNEQDIRNNSIEFEITLDGDEFAATLSSTFTDQIVSGGVWDADIMPNLSATRNSSASITVTVPRTNGFDINVAEFVSVTVLAVDLQHTGAGSFTASNVKTIDRIEPYIQLSSDPDPLYEPNIHGSDIYVDLFEDLFTAGVDAVDFQLDNASVNAGISIRNRSVINQLRVRLTLNFTGDLDNNHNINVSVLSTGLEGGASIIGAAAPVQVISVLEPVITAVTIPDAPIGIGQQVTALVRVEDDQGEVFDSIVGTIAERDVIPGSLNRVSSTEYEVDFRVAEDSDPEYLAADLIPVSGLQLFNDTTSGNTFNDLIDQPNDLLDSRRPQITLVSVNNGSYSIGDSFPVTVQSTESGLNFDASTSVNSVPLGPNVVPYDAGSGVYQLNYTVSEGDPDVAGDSMEINVVLLDKALNRNNVVNSYSGNDPLIDANSPVIVAIDETSSGTLVPDDQLIHTITAGEDGLLLGDNTLVNNIGVGSTRVALNSTGSNTYELVYLVGKKDAPVDAGQLELYVELTDSAGNASTFGGSVSNKDLSIVTSSPGGQIFTAGEVCAGDSAELVLSFSGGTTPYQVTVVGDNGFNTSLVSTEHEYRIKVAPEQNTQYRIERIGDALGQVSLNTDSVEVIVHVLPDVQFAPELNTTYVVEGEGSYTLDALPEGGVFSGPGVISSEDLFRPDIAGVSDSLEIVYIYEEPATGCVGTDTILFQVLAGTGSVEIGSADFSGIVCYSDAAMQVRGFNEKMNPGKFQLLKFNKDTDAFDLTTDGLSDTDPNDNQAELNPAQLGNASGSFLLRYNFILEGVSINIDRQFEFDYVPEISFSKTIPDAVCRNVLRPVALEATPSIGESFRFFSNEGGILGNEILGFTFEPDSAVVGTNTIYYEFVSDAGCSRLSEKVIVNFDVPDVYFTPKEVCIQPENTADGEGGGAIGFNNETTKPDLVAQWHWNFGDVNSGAANEVTIPGSGIAEGVIHKYTSPATRTVMLSIETVNGCAARFDSTIIFAGKPTAEFRVKSDCWVSGQPTVFVNESQSEKSWESFRWSISNLDRTWDTTFVTLDEESEVYFKTSSDTFRVELIVANIADQLNFCYDTITDSNFELKPTQHFEAGTDSRLMTFDISGEKWSVDSSMDYSSWTWGMPDFIGYTSQVGDNAWYTSRGVSNDIAEHSWIQSECFDMRGLERPMIRMDVMRSFDGKRDGAVIQYTTDNGDTWNTIGNIGEGINWYNAFNLSNEPGGGRNGDGSTFGWSGTESGLYHDSSWVTVAHDLEVIRGQSPVIFGIFYATDDGSLSKNQGFAVDNIYIGERKKKVLIEHFTNAGSSSAVSADDAIDAFVTGYSEDLVSLQYHMPYPGEDPMNDNNPSPASSRSFYYGVNEVPFALMDGGLTEEYRYDDFINWDPPHLQLNKVNLERPLFDIRLSMLQGLQHLRVNVTSTARDQVDSVEVQLHVAVVETMVTSYTGENGDSEFRNVVLDMLPSPAGTLYPDSRSWNAGDEAEESFYWDYKNIEDIDELMVVAFLQDRVTGKVLQVATIEDPEFPVEIIAQPSPNCIIYPNPSRSVLYIEYGSMLPAGGNAVITDMTGRVTRLHSISPGSERTEVNISTMAAGTYLLEIWDSNKVIGRHRFVKSE